MKGKHVMSSNNFLIFMQSQSIISPYNQPLHLGNAEPSISNLCFIGLRYVSSFDINFALKMRKNNWIYKGNFLDSLISRCPDETEFIIKK